MRKANINAGKILTKDEFKHRMMLDIQRLKSDREKKKQVNTYKSSVSSV